MLFIIISIIIIILIIYHLCIGVVVKFVCLLSEIELQLGPFILHFITPSGRGMRIKFAAGFIYRRGSLINYFSI